MYLVTMKPCWALLCFLIAHSTSGDDFSHDYYFGVASLRSDSDENACKNTQDEAMCHANCPRNHECFMKKCLCLEIDLGTRILSNILSNGRQREEQNPPSFIDLTKIQENEQQEDLKPALRHHIAHFCPNLDDARACIRKCMPLGKPAFCGKDHVCYCGHKYQAASEDKSLDAKATYAQFKDLYKKYFGENHGFAQSDESLEDTE